MTNSKFKICEKKLSLLAMEKLETIIIFSIVYGGLLYFFSLFIDGKSFLLVAIIILGIIGIVYNGGMLYFSNNFKNFGSIVPVKVLNSCIGRARSVDYGHYVYFPVIEYEYILNEKRIKSDKIYWDFDSFFYNRGVVGGLNEEESISHARKILGELVKKESAYCVNLYFTKVYLDIYLSPNRKKYFYNQIVLSIILITICTYFLLK